MSTTVLASGAFAVVVALIAAASASWRQRVRRRHELEMATHHGRHELEMATRRDRLMLLDHCLGAVYHARDVGRPRVARDEHELQRVLEVLDHCDSALARYRGELLLVTRDDPAAELLTEAKDAVQAMRAGVAVGGLDDPSVAHARAALDEAGKGLLNVV